MLDGDSLSVLKSPIRYSAMCRKKWKINFSFLKIKVLENKTTYAKSTMVKTKTSHLNTTLYNLEDDSCVLLKHYSWNTTWGRVICNFCWNHSSDVYFFKRFCYCYFILYTYHVPSSILYSLGYSFNFSRHSSCDIALGSTVVLFHFTLLHFIRISLCQPVGES